MSLVFKVSILGSFGVGKTSLVSQYVESVFSEAYKTTVGVNIKTKAIQVGEQHAKIVFWDIEGEEEISAAQRRYAPNSQAFVIVADATRLSTLETAQKYMQELVDIDLSKVVLLVNKMDLTELVQVEKEDTLLTDFAVKTFFTSAKMNMGVEEAFYYLAQTMLEENNAS